MFNFANLEGGDLGITDILTELVEFPVLVRHISRILNALPSKENAIPTYCFKFSYLVPQDVLKSTMIFLETQYKIKFYETDGSQIFALRGVSGGVVTAYVVYLMADK